MEQRRADTVGGKRDTSNMRSTVTPLDELRAAHKRLRVLAFDAAPGPWSVARTDVEEYDISGSVPFNVGSTYSKHDSDLIVTLHRTIDAQLAILSTAIDEVSHSGTKLAEDQFTRCDEPNACHEALVLARAINGEA